MRLVGASNLYIQTPFLLEGVIAGLIGWAIASGLLIGVKSLLLDNMQQYFSYNVGLPSSSLIQVILLIMLAAVVLCGVTSFVTLRRFLQT
jgi:cell division transport system permease protein